MSDIEYSGARFYKCALQVNPASYAGEQGRNHGLEEHEYNDAILEKCIENKIKVVGLADHGNVSSSKSLREKLTGSDITVFPGFEIASSEKIHMVCLYSSETNDEALSGYLAQLMGDNFNKLESQRTCASSLSCENIAKQISHQKGFWYAAHMTGRNGLLKLSGAGNNFNNLWKEEGLFIAGQIPGTINDLEGVSGQDKNQYKEIIENRNPDYERKRPVAIINAKDVDEPDTLSDPSASCLIKMTSPDFKAFCSAVYDPDSRIRLNYQIPEQPYSTIKSVQWSGGGFFRDESIGLSKHLNAFIGGRGTGKSTLIESIRFALDLPYRGDEDNSRALKSISGANISNSQVTVEVVSKAQNGQTYTISRRHGEQPVVKNKQGEISNLLPHDIVPEIELLGQNEILQIEKNEEVKLSLLKQFMPDSQQYDKNIEEIRQRLRKNRENLIKAEEEWDRLNTTVQQEPKLKEQEKQFKNLGIQNKLESVNLLEKERNIQDRIERQFDLVHEWLSSYEDIFDLAFLENGNIKELPNKEILTQIRQIFESLKGNLGGLTVKAAEHIKESKNKYREIKKGWAANSKKIQDALNHAIGQLPEQAGKTGRQLGREYTQIVQNLARIEQQKTAHERQREIIESLEKKRSELIENYREASFERFKDMQTIIQDLNNSSLRGKVKISVSRCGNKEALKNFMGEMHGISTAKTKWVDAGDIEIDLVEWSEWIKGKNTDAFMEKYKSSGLTSKLAESLSTLPTAKRLELEEIELKDIVSIALNIAHNNGDERYVPLESLSTGQKCTAILNLLLLSKDDPLIIDQPEDNLDNAFIADRIVKDIRKFKTSRQFLFATHNANIPVFGDAELIAVLSSEEDKGKIEYRGAIDKPAIRTQAAEILEGGKAAFEMRKKKYGF